MPVKFLHHPHRRKLDRKRRRRIERQCKPSTSCLVKYGICELALRRSICLDSFYEFLKQFWYCFCPEEPHWNWHIEFQCDEAQRIVENIIAGKQREYDLVINVPPGTSKSSIWSVALPAWALAKKNSFRTLVATHTLELGLDLSRKSRYIVESPLYQQMFPHVRLSKDQDNKHHWETNKHGKRQVATIGGKNPMGFHYNLIIVDDPINPEKAKQKVALKSAKSFMVDTLPSRMADKDVTVTVLVMQRLSREDPSGVMLESEQPIRHICLPGCDEFPIRPKRLKKRYVNGLLDPKRCSQKVIDSARARGIYYFSGQIGQAPQPLGGGMFKVGRIHADTPPKKFRRIVRYWDNAATKDGGAYTVGVKMGLDYEGGIWILDVVRGQWDTHERERIKKQTAKLDGYGVIVCQEREPGSGGKDTILMTRKRLVGFTFLEDKVAGEGDKLERAVPFSSEVNGGNVYIPLKAFSTWAKDYLDELRFFQPTSAYKDQVDGSSGAYRMLTRQALVLGAL